MRHKHPSIDKYDGHMPNKPHFVQDNFFVSDAGVYFHCGQFYVWDSDTDSGKSGGIQRKMWKVSGRGGTDFDPSGRTGKSDNL